MSFRGWKNWGGYVVAISIGLSLALFKEARTGALGWSLFALAMIILVTITLAFVGAYAYEHLHGSNMDPTPSDSPQSFQLEGIPFAAMAVGTLVVTLVPGMLILWFTQTGLWAYGILIVTALMSLVTLAFVYRAAGKSLL